MSPAEHTRERIASLIEENRVLLFMKGTRRSPQCGFSARVISILDSMLSEYETFDVLSDPEIREGIKVFSSWPTIPQLYVAGEFIGGCDIVTELYESGELHEKLGVPLKAVEPPTIRITDAAAEALRQTGAGAKDKELHLAIDAQFQNQLYLGPRKPGELFAKANGIGVWIDRSSAERAEGLTIDVVQTTEGPGFRIENPNAPVQVKQLSPAGLKRMLDDQEPLRLFDVRTQDEQAQARIPQARLLTPEVVAEIEGLDKDTVLVFHCHHGGRSQKAAEHFGSLGFRNVYNLAGGIDAWSREVDPKVPRY
ncbi:MAG TPA: Grx4 family monothiol glutaredoxin [Deltaproteobacteria bacterium]|jgi:monothiol glutaredoxin|nr:Grx4 family monothiol glutaredoxin [Deltaproteobacteria bacterium]